MKESKLEKELICPFIEVEGEVEKVMLCTWNKKCDSKKQYQGSEKRYCERSYYYKNGK